MEYTNIQQAHVHTRGYLHLQPRPYSTRVLGVTTFEVLNYYPRVLSTYTWYHVEPGNQWMDMEVEGKGKRVAPVWWYL